MKGSCTLTRSKADMVPHFRVSLRISRGAYFNTKTCPAEIPRVFPAPEDCERHMRGNDGQIQEEPDCMHGIDQ